MFVKGTKMNSFESATINSISKLEEDEQTEYKFSEKYVILRKTRTGNGYEQFKGNIRMDFTSVQKGA